MLLTTVVLYGHAHSKIRQNMRIFPNLKYVEISYNSLNISLSDVISCLQGLLFSIPVVLLSVPCTS